MLMNFHARHLILPLAIVAALAPAGPAAASPEAVVRDCIDGSLEREYSDGDKRAALQQIPADVDEYSDCRAVIAGSIGGGPLAGASSAGGGGDGGSKGAAGDDARKPGTRTAAEERSERRREKARDVLERSLGKRSVDPRDAGVLKAARTANGLPLPVALAVGALALLSLTGGVLVLMRRNPRFAGVLRRVTPPRFRR